MTEAAETTTSEEALGDFRGLTSPQVDERCEALFGLRHSPRDWLQEMCERYPDRQQVWWRAYQAARERARRQFDVYWAKKHPDLGDAPFEEFRFDDRDVASRAAATAWMEARGFQL
jgi:hypothetical protein